MPHFAHDRFVSADGLCLLLFNAFLIYKNRGFLHSKFCGFINLQPKSPVLSYFKKNMPFSCTLFKEMSQFGICLHICSYTVFPPVQSGLLSSFKAAGSFANEWPYYVHCAVQCFSRPLEARYPLEMCLKHVL